MADAGFTCKKGNKNFYAGLQAKRKEIKQRKTGQQATEQQAPQKLQMWWNVEHQDELYSREELIERKQAQLLSNKILERGQLVERLQEGKTNRSQPLKKIAVIKKAYR